MASLIWTINWERGTPERRRLVRAVDDKTLRKLRSHCSLPVKRERSEARGKIEDDLTTPRNLPAPNRQRSRRSASFVLRDAFNSQLPAQPIRSCRFRSRLPLLLSFSSGASLRFYRCWNSDEPINNVSNSAT